MRRHASLMENKILLSYKYYTCILNDNGGTFNKVVFHT